MVRVYNYGIGGMIDAQRFDQKYYGPINSTFNMLIGGLVTFRAYRKFDFYRIQFMHAVDSSANCTFCYNMLNRWVGLRLDCICSLFGIATACFAVAMKDSDIPRALLTFSLQIVTDVIVFFSYSIRMYAELQNMMTSS